MRWRRGSRSRTGRKSSPCCGSRRRAGSKRPRWARCAPCTLKKLRDADKHGRFHAYYPHIPGLPEGQCCDLHSKLMIVDDECLRIGSANFSNRSMGLDTECDVAIEARGEERIARAIREFRNTLLGEHLDVPRERVAQAMNQAGSLHGRHRRAGERRAFAAQVRASRRGVGGARRRAQSSRIRSKPVSLDTLIEQFAPEMTPRSARPGWVAARRRPRCSRRVLTALWQLHAARAMGERGSRHRVGAGLLAASDGRRCWWCWRTRPRASSVPAAAASRCSRSRRSARGTASRMRSSASSSPR